MGSVSAIGLIRRANRNAATPTQAEAEAEAVAAGLTA